MRLPTCTGTPWSCGNLLEIDYFLLVIIHGLCSCLNRCKSTTENYIFLAFVNNTIIDLIYCFKLFLYSFIISGTVRPEQITHCIDKLRDSTYSTHDTSGNISRHYLSYSYCRLPKTGKTVNNVIYFIVQIFSKYGRYITPKLFDSRRKLCYSSPYSWYALAELPCITISILYIIDSFFHIREKG